jgi:hypothetical protein
MPNFESRPDYLLISPDGVYSLEHYKQAVSQALSICLDKGMNKILADVRGLDSRVPVMDRYELGVHIAHTLGTRIAMAIVSSARAFDKLAEDTAVNRGGRVLVTEDVNEAMRWLQVER